MMAGSPSLYLRAVEPEKNAGLKKRKRRRPGEKEGYNLNTREEK